MKYNCDITQNGDRYDVVFPDMSNVLTCGFSLEEAKSMAKGALNAILEEEVEEGLSIPEPAYHGGYPVEVEPRITLAIRLRELRGNNTQSDIATRLGIKYQSYQRLENPAKANPTIKTLEKIAHAYGEPFEALFA
jgi:antitoxin HicB